MSLSHKNTVMFQIMDKTRRIADRLSGNTPHSLTCIYVMESETRSRLGGKDDDIDVDHYFLPGGILDTHHEEDMIGGSLLDEIGGAGNVKAVSRSPTARGVDRCTACSSSVIGLFVNCATLPFPQPPARQELLPAKQMAVSRVVGSDPRTASSTAVGSDRLPHQLQRKPTSVISAGPT